MFVEFHFSQMKNGATGIVLFLLTALKEPG